VVSRYETSSARIEFLRSLEEIENVIRKIAPPKRIDPDLKNYMHGAAILFLSAKLENYISDLFEGIAQEICRNCAQSNKLPKALLGWIFLNDGNEIISKRYIANSDEGEYISSTGDKVHEVISTFPATYITHERTRGISNKSYPSVKNVKRMYKRLGVNSIFNLLNRRLRRDVEADLKSLNDIRGSLAHSGITGTHSYQDVKNLIKNTKDIVQWLDKETFYHLRSENCLFAWKTS